MPNTSPPPAAVAARSAVAVSIAAVAAVLALLAAVLRGAAGGGVAGWLEVALCGAAAIAALLATRLAVAGSRAAAPTVGAALRAAAAPADHDGAAAVMGPFSRMVGTIEAQATEISQFAARLESAYSDLEFTNARLKEFSFKDVVTGLYNRRFFSIRLEEEASRYRRFTHPVSVVLLDLDGFKAVNDELGHAAGDETLRNTAEILMHHSRGINVICRYGGDEFAVLLVETSKAGAKLYADRIRQVLATYPFGHGRRVTASIGIACLPDDVHDPSADDLIRAADDALRAAKRAGKNRVSLYEDAAGSGASQATGGAPRP
jgi:diguanylate cyclase (GGDEF)-like protein